MSMAAALGRLYGSLYTRTARHHVAKHRRPAPATSYSRVVPLEYAARFSYDVRALLDGKYHT